MTSRSDNQRKAMFANMSNPRSKKKSKRLRRAKRGSVSSSVRKSKKSTIDLSEYEWEGKKVVKRRKKEPRIYKLEEYIWK